MAILGVLGCSALLIFGLGLSYTTSGLSQRMYHDINRYESRVLLEDSVTKWMTSIGILLGIPSGMALIKVLLSTMSDSLDFVMVISPLTYVISIVGTFMLSIFVNFIQSSKIKRVDMVGSLKSVE